MCIVLIFAGVLTSYFGLQITLWWLFHIFSMFWKLQFPFHSRLCDNMKQTKYVHALCIMVALIFPMVPSIVISVESGFTVNYFPPSGCIGRDANIAFYSTLLPITLCYAVGTTLLLAIMWKIKRVSNLSLPSFMTFIIVVL